MYLQMKVSGQQLQLNININHDVQESHYRTHFTHPEFFLYFNISECSYNSMMECNLNELLYFTNVII